MDDVLDDSVQTRNLRFVLTGDTGARKCLEFDSRPSTLFKDTPDASCFLRDAYFDEPWSKISEIDSAGFD